MSPSKPKWVSRADSSVYLPTPKPKSKKKRAKPAPKPSTPGKTCTNCGQDYVQADPGDDYHMYPRYDEVPHENPFDCIRHLSARMKEVGA